MNTPKQQDAIDAFNNAVMALLPKHCVPTFDQRMSAINAVATRNPELHQEYLIATNTGKRVERLIREKYDA